MTDRIECPWKVEHESLFAPVTKYRNGTERRMTSSYFVTKEEALAFCQNSRKAKIKFSPGEAWKHNESV